MTVLDRAKTLRKDPACPDFKWYIKTKLNGGNLPTKAPLVSVLSVLSGPYRFHFGSISSVVTKPSFCLIFNHAVANLSRLSMAKNEFVRGAAATRPSFEYFGQPCSRAPSFLIQLRAVAKKLYFPEVQDRPGVANGCQTDVQPRRINSFNSSIRLAFCIAIVWVSVLAIAVVE